MRRLGGEESVILLPRASATISAEIAEHMRVLVEGIVVDGIDITISCGVASADQTRVHMPELVSG